MGPFRVWDKVGRLPTGFLSEVDISKVGPAWATWDFTNHSRKGDLKADVWKIPSPGWARELERVLYCSIISDHDEMYEYKWMQMQKYGLHDSARQINTLSSFPDMRFVAAF